MKIAACFFGQPREVELGFYKFNEFILKKYQVDVFAHLWNSDQVSVRKFCDLYEPKKLIVEEQIQFDTNRYQGAYGIEIIHKEAYDRLFNSISQCYSYKAVNDIMKSYGDYDLVIKARTDTVIYKFDADLYDVDTSKYVVPSEPVGFIYNDVIAICNKKTSDIVASKYEKLHSWYDSGIRDFIPESLTLRILRENGIDILVDNRIHCNIILK